MVLSVLLLGALGVGGLIAYELGVLLPKEPAATEASSAEPTPRIAANASTPVPTPTPRQHENPLMGPGLEAGERATASLPTGVEMAFRWCPPGISMMGSPSGEEGRNFDEGPQTRVTHARGLWVSETEVTQAQWQAVMGNLPGNLAFRGNSENPVEQVTWNEIMGPGSTGQPVPQPGSFMLRFREATGLNATLPTEAQWEYACRAGSSTR